MAQRTTIADVRDLIPTWASDALTDDQIQMAIDSATCLVDRIAESYCGESLSEACLTQLETLLSGHFLALTYPLLGLSSETTDDCCKSSVRYSWKFGDGILGTNFGIAANTLSGGCVAEYDKQPANIWSIGSHGGSAGDYYN